jgi:hypothetical protein
MGSTSVFPVTRTCADRWGWSTLIRTMLVGASAEVSFACFDGAAM